MEANIIRNGAATDQVTAPWSNNPFASRPQLPTELLVTIFQLSLPEIDFKSSFSPRVDVHPRMQRLYIMRSVSKRWQAVIEGTPSFWTIIAWPLPSHVNEASIFRSSGLPLSIVCYHLQRALPGGIPSVTEFFKLIQYTRPRWSTVNFQQFDRTATSSYLGSTLPLLQTITVTGPNIRSRLPKAEPLELLGGDTSNLRSVYLSGVSIRWRTGCLVQLKCLELRRVAYNSPTAQPLLGALHASPGLQILTLTRMRGTDIPQPSPTITLHHLKRIQIELCAFSLVQCILGRIQAPSCTGLRLTLTARGQGSDVPHILDGALKSFHPILRNMHRLRGGSEVVLHSDEVSWRTQNYSGEEGFEIHMQDFHDPFFTDWVDRTLEDESGPTIIFGRIRGRVGPFGEAMLRSVASLRRVTKVAVESLHTLGVSVVLQLLSKPLTTSASLPSLPCLQELDLPSTDWKTRDLLEMVQSRFCTLGWEGMERTPLKINVLGRGLRRRGGPGLLIDLATLVNIRNTTGVERFNLGGRKHPEGILAVVWNDVASKAVWV